MVQGFGPEGLGSIPDAVKDPPSAYGVHAHKIHGSKSPMVSFQQFAVSVVSGENFPPFQRHIKIGEVEMDGAAIYCREVEVRLLLLKYRPPYSGIMYPFLPQTLFEVWPLNGHKTTKATTVE